jgi:hypothetical protein
VLSSTHFQLLLERLAEGDLSFYGALSENLGDVPAHIAIGDLFIGAGSGPIIMWYEALEPSREGTVFVRYYSRVIKRGDYDRVGLNALAASVTRGLFDRARANGFRTIRRYN